MMAEREYKGAPAVKWETLIFLDHPPEFFESELRGLLRRELGVTTDEGMAECSRLARKLLAAGWRPTQGARVLERRIGLNSRVVHP
jgi:hypothetical protein